MVASNFKHLWDRVVEDSWEHLEPPAARALLGLRFAEKDIARMNDLARRANEGSLNEDEQSEMEHYARADAVISIMQSKARRALKQSNV